MPNTSPRVSFGLFDLQLKLDSSLSCPDQQPFSKLTDLTADSATARPYASYEPDFWLLDGQYKILPEVYTTVHLGLMSLSMSGADGAFAAPPVLTITFSEPHTSDGLALTFNPITGDYCSLLTVAYYNTANGLIRSDEYEPTGPEFSTNQAVSNFKKIVVSFQATSRPNRYLRLTGLNFGEIISFAGTDIKTANVTEDLSQLSTEVYFNELDLTLYSADAQFSLLNPEGQYVTLKERQPLDVYETVDGVDRYIGRYYLEEWKNLSDTDYQFRALDLIGILDKTPYRGGIWLGAGIALEDLIESLLGPISVPYELDSELVGTAVIGWLPAGTYRTALQQIGFAVGASITCARSGAVRIFKSRIASAMEAGHLVTRAMKGQEQSVALKPMVTAVEVTAHNYQPGGESQVVMSGQYAAGVYEVTFSDPMHAFSLTGGALLESGVNYAKIAVPVSGTVVLTGLKYVDTQAVKTISTPTLGAGIRPNVIEVKEATLVHSGNVAAVAHRLYDYTQQRYLQSIKLYAPSIEPGSVVIVDTLYSQQLRAVVEKMNTDLAKGFVSKVELTGVLHVG